MSCLICVKRYQQIVLQWQEPKRNVRVRWTEQTGCWRNKRGKKITEFEICWNLSKGGERARKSALFLAHPQPVSNIYIRNTHAYFCLQRNPSGWVTQREHIKKRHAKSNPIRASLLSAFTTAWTALWENHAWLFTTTHSLALCVFVTSVVTMKPPVSGWWK